MHLRFVCGFFLFNFINFSDAVPRIPKEVSVARVAINVAYTALKEEQDEMFCKNTRTREFKSKIDEYIHTEHIIRNKTVKLNEDFYKYITTTACDTLLKENIKNMSNLSVKINECFDKNIGKSKEDKPRATKSVEANNNNTNIVPYLFSADIKIVPIDYNSINALMLLKLNECLERESPFLNTTIQRIFPNITKPAIVTNSTLPIVETSSDLTWVYILIAVVIVVGVAIAVIIVLRNKKRKLTFVDTTEFELQSTGQHQKTTV